MTINGSMHCTTHVRLCYCTIHVRSCVSGSGVIEFPEFLTMMVRNTRHNDTQEDLRAAFQIFDKDCSGNNHVGGFMRNV